MILDYIQINQFYHVINLVIFIGNLQVRENCFNTLLRFGKLSQQFWTDQWAKVERHRLLWCELNQKTLKAEKYQGLLDATTNNDLPSAGHNVILAPTITGSPRYIWPSWYLLWSGLFHSWAGIYIYGMK